MNKHQFRSRRRVVYIDHVLQKWLLMAMVVLEALLTALAIFGLYRVLAGIMDDNLYRVHILDEEDITQRFLVEGALILAATGVVNLVAIITADRVWAIYVRRILRGLESIMYAARKLDLRPCSGVRRAHAVLDQALRWQRAQSLRLKRIRYSVRSLPASLPSTDEEKRSARDLLKLIQDRGRSVDDD